MRFYKGCTDFFSSQEKFEVLEEYLGFTGIHVKILTIGPMKVDPLIFQKFLSLLSNLESLELSLVESAELEQVPIKWNLKPSKIERIRLFGCTALEGLLETLESCAIQEVKLKDWPSSKSELLQKFLEAQKESLKMLVGSNCDFNFLANVKDLRLEHLEYDSRESTIGFLEFLKRQVDLKFLSLCLSEYSDEALSTICITICGLKNLETLVLDGDWGSSDGLKNLHKLKKLKRLKVGHFINWNILNHMQFGVYKDLEELDAHFFNVFEESVREMSQITPNLKKLVIHSAPSSTTINVFLETLDSLESVKIQDTWKMSRKVCPNIKHLHVKTNRFKFNADQMTRKFPNLEDLKIEALYLDVTELFFAELLSGLKQLKTLCMRIWSNSKLDPKSALQCFQEHGNHLDDVNIIFVCEPQDYVYAIEKKSFGAFCIRKKDEINSTWIYGNSPM
jgi:hypothetical protein